MRISTLFLLLFSLDVLSVAGQDLEKTVRKMQRDYPEMRLQDVYKSFYQDRFGPRHLVSDSATVCYYLQQELQQSDNPKVLYEPTGNKGRFYRVHLVCVQRGYITAEELYNAFVQSANRAEPRRVCSDSYNRRNADTLSWSEEWHRIVAAIEKANLKLENYEADKQMIEEMLATKGDVAIHHSSAFREAYHPHYRIVKSDIFKRELLRKIPRGTKHRRRVEQH
ncbi:MAG: hypothetical protein K5890_11620 [Bacteroidales bacterium]|nr:hypothetical protein [Bacteroidales bacterium]